MATPELRTNRTDRLSHQWNLELAPVHRQIPDYSDNVVDETGLDATKYIQLNQADDLLFICRMLSVQFCYGLLRRSP